MTIEFPELPERSDLISENEIRASLRAMQKTHRLRTAWNRFKARIHKLKTTILK